MSHRPPHYMYNSIPRIISVHVNWQLLGILEAVCRSRVLVYASGLHVAIVFRNNIIITEMAYRGVTECCILSVLSGLTVKVLAMLISCGYGKQWGASVWWTHT